jgi:Putative Actinobacterial Holin-X, holin superfamily III
MEPERNSNSNSNAGADPETDEASISELMQRLSDQTSSLARKEIELAKAEVTQKGKRLGIGAGAFGAAGIIGLFAFGALTAGLILLLGTAVDDWLAAVIVGAVYTVAAGGLALTGKQQVEAGSPPVPERAIESTKQDVEAAKAGYQEGHNV